MSPRGEDEHDAAALYRNNPELATLLRTQFEAITVGYRSGGRVAQGLPPRPPGIHGFVVECPAMELRDFGRGLEFLRLLAGTPMRVPVDELIGAALRQLSRTGVDQREYLVAAGKRLTALVENDVNRLSAILGAARR